MLARGLKSRTERIEVCTKETEGRYSPFTVPRKLRCQEIYYTTENDQKKEMITDWKNARNSDCEPTRRKLKFFVKQTRSERELKETKETIYFKDKKYP